MPLPEPPGGGASRAAASACAAARWVPAARRSALERALVPALALAAALALLPAAGCGGKGAGGESGEGASAHRAAAPAPSPARPTETPAARADRRADAAPDGPRVALVIDDLGQRLGGPAAVILALPVPLTLAVLPGLPHSRAYAALAAAPDRELFLHLPMQPLDYPESDPGPGALAPGQDEAEVTSRLEAALASVPGALGVNNHMGSAATADRALMDTLMRALRDRDLRFLDSLTSSGSVAWQAAREAGVPTARNRIFLDAAPGDEAAITANLAELVRVARERGQAIGIAHPHRVTADVLAREVPRYLAEGMRFVKVTELMPAAAGAVAAAEVADGR